MIDGGKGQLAAALEAIHATYDLPRVAVVALAKREEEVYVPGRSAPIRLERHDPGLQLLQRARDEAHRFALGFHRRRRDTRAFESIFDDLEGIGPARRRAILNHFGSAESFLSATQEELEGVPGLPAKTARTSTRSCTRPDADEAVAVARGARGAPVPPALARADDLAARRRAHRVALAFAVLDVGGSASALGVVLASFLGARAAFILVGACGRTGCRGAS